MVRRFESGNHAMAVLANMIRQLDPFNMDVVKSGELAPRARGGHGGR